MDGKHGWKRLRQTAVVLLVLFVLARTLFERIPDGAVRVPYLIASRTGPVLVSPAKNRLIRIFYNDAGGAHSGNHWTWVVAYSLSRGRYVVAEGYLGAR